MNNKINRRRFLFHTSVLGAGILAGPALLSSCDINQKKISITDANNASVGHLLRTGKFPEPAEEITIPALILGGGVSGLSAARRLIKKRFNEFLLLELDEKIGGNSSSRSNDINAYPLGAHYLPIVSNHNKELLFFLEENGIITKYDGNGMPFYKEEYLCAEPDERLFCNGMWQEGIIPTVGQTEADILEFRRFLEMMETYKWEKDADGKYAFDLPLEHSSSKPEYTKLDSISMTSWLSENGFKSENLKWYVDYCCKDDFGTSCDDTSAWAGIHYFAARKASAANAQSDDVLTWPEGNGFLVNCLQNVIPQDKIQTNQIVYSISNADRGFEVLCYDVKKQRSLRISTQKIINALPLFVHRKMQGNVSQTIADSASNVSYAPWLVANLSVSNQLQERLGSKMSWDNVIMNQQSLGYVNSSHQLPIMKPTRLVLTYYRPLSGSDAKAERMKAYETANEEWGRSIFDELKIIHPDIEAHTTSVEIKLWGHAMPRPVIGALWEERPKRNETLSQVQNVYFAHCDHGGISVFEEAFHQGLSAADALLRSIQ
jgi:protoporphyrinogen oxidase